MIDSLGSQKKLEYAKQHNLEIEDIDFFVVSLKDSCHVDAEETCRKYMDEGEKQ